MIEGPIVFKGLKSSHQRFIAQRDSTEEDHQHVQPQPQQTNNSPFWRSVCVGCVECRICSEAFSKDVEYVCGPGVRKFVYHSQEKGERKQRLRECPPVFREYILCAPCWAPSKTRRLIFFFVLLIGLVLEQCCHFNDPTSPFSVLTTEMQNQNPHRAMTSTKGVASSLLICLGEPKGIMKDMVSAVTACPKAYHKNRKEWGLAVR